MNVLQLFVGKVLISHSKWKQIRYAHLQLQMLVQACHDPLKSTVLSEISDCPFYQMDVFEIIISTNRRRRERYETKCVKTKNFQWYIYINLASWNWEKSAGKLKLFSLLQIIWLQSYLVKDHIQHLRRVKLITFSSWKIS